MALMRPLLSRRGDLGRIFEDLEREMLAPVWTHSVTEPTEWAPVWTPPINVIEEEKEIKVKALVPGIKPEDIDIEVDNNTLALRGESFKTEEEEKGNFYRKEIAQTRVYRRVQLPAEVQSDKAQAKFENGMLTVTIPKLAETKKHKIKVNRK